MSATTATATLTNGPGAAAVLAAGIGSFALGLFAVLAEKITTLKSWTNFYNPTGPLSGVTTMAVIVWLAAWAILNLRWRGREVRLVLVSRIALALLAVGMLLTIPPIADLF
ncbi:MAG TPA: hypothetical protein VL986_13530 [Terracidiphilus sp.]|nr:hypothetical protein [Terracidiphilus sp.]